MIFSENNLEHFLYASFKFGKVSRNPSMKFSVKVILDKKQDFLRMSHSVRHVSLFYPILRQFCKNGRHKTILVFMGHKPDLSAHL